MFDLKQAVRELVRGCIIPARDGTRMYTPDGMQNYRAFWTRDFTYMVCGAGEMIPTEDLVGGVDYFLRFADTDGWIPDRVDPEGNAWYTAGAPLPAGRNLDNSCFLAILADKALERLAEPMETYRRWEPGLARALKLLPRKNGIVDNRTQPPHSPYGFTDTVAKSGLLAMETLLYWQACGILLRRNREAGLETAFWEQEIARIEQQFCGIFGDGSGMLISATGDCRQIDVWASVYAMAIGFPLTPALKTSIPRWIAENFDTVTQDGQLRHLPAGTFWEKTFLPVEPGTYQNGAFWAVPSGWCYLALKQDYPQLAVRLIDELLAYFETEGIYECVNGKDRKLPTYVASGTCVYGIYPDYLALKASGI